MYLDLVKKIRKLLDKNEVVIVAISGHGGSGKSTLAESLAREFGINKSQILSVDKFHAKNYLDVKDIFQQHEWSELKKLLTNARSNDKLYYLSRDWQGNEQEVNFARPKPLIVEGIRLISSDMIPLFDLSIWIECPVDVAAKRAIERNRQQGDSKEDIDLWYTKWIPESKQYEEQIHPQKIADYVYTEYNSAM